MNKTFKIFKSDRGKLSGLPGNSIDYNWSDLVL